MKYFYQHAHLGVLGPHTLEELKALHRAGAIRGETPLRPEVGDAVVLFRDVCPEAGLSGVGAAGGSGSVPPVLPPSSPPFGAQDSFTRRAGADLRVMLPHLTLPFEELRSFRWLENRRTLSIACIGLLPLVVYAIFGGGTQIGNAFWAMALYFSALWALFFYYVFPTPEARFAPASFCFFATGILSIPVLLHLYRIWPLSSLLLWTRPENPIFVQWLGFVLGVGVPEEFCKALVLFFLVRRFGPFPPQAVLFYGLIAGLGFGIYEGLSYQTSHNFRFAWDAAGYRDRALFAAEYYLLNLIRLTTLPFLHAIWTGTAGYFIGFAAAYPQRKRGLLLVAIGAPAFLHGSYNAFSTSALGLAIALVSVLALNLYLAKSVDFERLLKENKPR